VVCEICLKFVRNSINELSLTVKFKRSDKGSKGGPCALGRTSQEGGDLPGLCGRTAAGPPGSCRAPTGPSSSPSPQAAISRMRGAAEGLPGFYGRSTADSPGLCGGFAGPDHPSGPGRWPGLLDLRIRRGYRGSAGLLRRIYRRARPGYGDFAEPRNRRPPGSKQDPGGEPEDLRGNRRTFTGNSPGLCGRFTEWLPGPKDGLRAGWPVDLWRWFQLNSTVQVF
jgi:hypothetical protein